VPVGEAQVAELAAAPDLQVLGQLGQRGDQVRRRPDHGREPVGLPHRVAGVLDDAVEAEQVGHPLPVAGERAAVDAAGAGRAAVDPVEVRGEPVDVAQRRVDRAQQVVPERRGLGVLQVGLLGHHGLGVRIGHPGTRQREPRGRLDQVDRVPPHPQPQRDAHRLAARPAGVQPPGVVPDAGREAALPAVVDLPVHRVVAELGHRGAHRVQQHPEQPPGGRVGHHPALAQHQHVRQVGDVQAAVQQRGVGHLDGETALDQLLGVAAGHRARPASRARVRRRLASASSPTG
jgi:hypothetical protein